MDKVGIYAKERWGIKNTLFQFLKLSRPGFLKKLNIKRLNEELTCFQIKCQLWDPGLDLNGNIAHVIKCPPQKSLPAM